MRVSLECSPLTSESPITLWVHRRANGEKRYRRQIPREELNPPMPRREIGKGFKVWRVDHLGHQLYFSGAQEMEHVAYVLGRRVMPSTGEIVARYGLNSRGNNHWLSRLHKTWKPWKVRQRLVAALEKAIEEEKKTK